MAGRKIGRQAIDDPLQIRGQSRIGKGGDRLVNGGGLRFSQPHLLLRVEDVGAGNDLRNGQCRTTLLRNRLQRHQRTEEQKPER